jgi:hypothetical protein
LSPASGAVGTSVTIPGSGFGSVQGSGLVMIGGAAAQVTSWSDTQVIVTIPSTSLTGVVRIQQNGVWSNALTFTVPASGGNSVTLSPNLITMLVGDTHTIQGNSGQHTQTKFLRRAIAASAGSAAFLSGRFGQTLNHGGHPQCPHPEIRDSTDSTLIRAVVALVARGFGSRPCFVWVSLRPLRLCGEYRRRRALT